MAEHSNSLQSIFYALGANLAIFTAKLTAAIMTGSGAMLAEAVHSPCRLRQPAAAAGGIETGEKAGHAGVSPRFRQEHLFLVLHRRPDHVQHGRGVFDLRGLPQAPASGRPVIALDCDRGSRFLDRR